MELREELPDDKEPVREIHLRAFGDHGLVVANLVDTLRETITPKDGLSLVAGHDGQIVGHVMFTRSLLDAPRRLVEVHVLSPLAVMPGYQKRGIGSALVRKGLKALAKSAGRPPGLPGGRSRLLLTLRVCARWRPGLPEAIAAHSGWCLPGHQAPGI